MSPQEPVRSWYSRTTRKAVRLLVIATIAATGLAVAFFAGLPAAATLKLQIFNGAWTIPVYGGLWLASFILIWLVPMREIGFRGQEAMERIEGKFSSMVEKFERTVDKLDKKLDTTDPDRLVLDIRAELGKIHAEVKRMADASTKPIESPMRRLVAPVRPISVQECDRGNGSDQE